MQHDNAVVAAGNEAAQRPAADRSLFPKSPPAPPLLAAIGAATDWVVVGIGATMIVLVFINVCLHVASLDLAWVTELAELLMVWATFLGGACATRRGAQMTITEFIDRVGGRRRLAADAAVDLFGIAVLATLVWFGMNLVAAGWGNLLTVLQIPMSFQYLGMPVGCALMLLWLAWDLRRILRGDTRAERWGGPGAKDEPAPTPASLAARPEARKSIVTADRN